MRHTHSKPIPKHKQQSELTHECYTARKRSEAYFLRHSVEYNRPNVARVPPFRRNSIPPMDETYANPPSYQNMATAPPLANNNFSPTSLRVRDPSAPPPSYEEAVGSVDKTNGEGLKPSSGPGGYSSIDDQSYTPRFKNEPRTWESDPSTVITNTHPGTRSNRTTNQGEVCTADDCKTFCDVCVVCLYCCWCFVEILSAFK